MSRVQGYLREHAFWVGMALLFMGGLSAVLVSESGRVSLGDSPRVAPEDLRPPAVRYFTEMCFRDGYSGLEVRKGFMRFGREEWLSGMVECLRSGHPITKTCAAHALGDWGDARALGPLEKATRDEKDFVRRAAVEALAKLRKSQAG